ncbi:hypothetical protein Tco_0846425 [Tanacetum coccineum]
MQSFLNDCLGSPTCQSPKTSSIASFLASRRRHKYWEMAGMVPQGYLLYCKFSPCGDTTLVLRVYKWVAPLVLKGLTGEILSCGVHTLLMDGTLTCFNVLVEKRYPLIKEMLQKMLNWKLEAEAESTMAFELLKFIKSQLEE